MKKRWQFHLLHINLSHQFFILFLDKIPILHFHICLIIIVSFLNLGSDIVISTVNLSQGCASSIFPTTCSLEVARLKPAGHSLKRGFGAGRLLVTSMLVVDKLLSVYIVRLLEDASH